MDERKKERDDLIVSFHTLKIVGVNPNLETHDLCHQGLKKRKTKKVAIEERETLVEGFKIWGDEDGFGIFTHCGYLG